MARRNARSTDAPPSSRGSEAPQTQTVGALARRLDLIAAEAEHEREQLAERLEELADPLRDRLQGPALRVNRWWRRVSSLKPYRVWIQFSHNDGNLRTAGMSYQTLFAVFAALWVGFSIAGIWLTGDTRLMRAMIDLVDDAVPELIGTHGSTGVISEEALHSLGTAFGWTSAIALVAFLWTAVAWLYYTRQAVRAMFDLERDERNYALQKITDFGLAIVFGVILVVSASVSVVTTEALTGALDLLGVGDDSFWSRLLARVVGFAISIALNFFTLAAMFRVLSRVVIPWRPLAAGSLLGGLALSGLGVLSGLLIGGASGNPLLASFAVFVGLLLWFNMICRVILLSAAWIAVGMSDRGLDPRGRSPEQLAYERAVAERSARLLVARTELADARRRAASTRGVARWVAGRRVRDARAQLARVEAEPPPRPPRKRSWWTADGTEGGGEVAGSVDRGPRTKGVGGDD